jgi:hypothetical protein
MSTTVRLIMETLPSLFRTLVLYCNGSPLVLLDLFPAYLNGRTPAGSFYLAIPALTWPPGSSRSLTQTPRTRPLSAPSSRMRFGQESNKNRSSLNTAQIPKCKRMGPMFQIARLGRLKYAKNPTYVSMAATSTCTIQ